jgi:flagellar motor switch protein FliN/FliY
MKSHTKGKSNLSHLLDVGFKVRADFGTAQMTLQEILDLQQRGLVELDRAPDGFVDLYIDDQKIARGEVLAMGNRYGVRITEIIETPLDRPQFAHPTRHSHGTEQQQVASFAEMLRDAEAEDARMHAAAPRVHDHSFADAYEFPNIDENGGRHDEPTSGPVDRESETYSPRRSVPNHRHNSE